MAQIKKYEVTFTRKVWSTDIVGSLKNLNVTEDVRTIVVDGTSMSDVQERICAPFLAKLVEQQGDFINAYFHGDKSVRVSYKSKVRVLWDATATGMSKDTAAKAVARGKANAKMAKAARRKAKRLANKAARNAGNAA